MLEISAPFSVLTAGSIRYEVRNEVKSLVLLCKDVGIIAPSLGDQPGGRLLLQLGHIQ